MTFDKLATGSSVFLDANTLIYHFQPHAVYGPPCTNLLERIENQDLTGFTSTHIVSEMAHRLMTMEAAARFDWPFTGIAKRLGKNPAHTQQLTQFRQAIQEIPKYDVKILALGPHLLDNSAAISQQVGLLSNDALMVAVMRELRDTKPGKQRLRTRPRSWYYTLPPSIRLLTINRLS